MKARNYIKQIIKGLFLIISLNIYPGKIVNVNLRLFNRVLKCKVDHIQLFKSGNKWYQRHIVIHFLPLKKPDIPGILGRNRTFFLEPQLFKKYNVSGNGI